MNRPHPHIAARRSPRSAAPGTLWVARRGAPLILAILVGCTTEPAPAPATESPPQASTAIEKRPADLKTASHTSRPLEGDTLAAPKAAHATRPASPAKPIETSPIEDPPIIGTPQEVFNFPRPPLVMPQVLLTDAERTASPVGVGQVVPPIELPDLLGAKKMLSSLFGKKLTVLVFWNDRNPYAVEELGDLGPMIVDRFGAFGVSVVGINVGDSADIAGKAIHAAGARFPNLLDADGRAFAKLAAGAPPRTYLLDASGKILWFDLEYSRSTRRDLKRAIQFVLLSQRSKPAQ